MMKSLKFGSLIMALMLFFVGAHAQNSVEKVKIGDTMPQFTLNSDVYGQVTPSDLKGKVVLVSLFATWCGPCQKELAEVQSTLYPKYKDNENFRLLVSAEMKDLFQWKEVTRAVEVVTPEFMVYKNGKPTTVVIYAKMCRGEMTRFILKNRIEDIESLKSFEWEGFTFDEALSQDNRLIFTLK